MKNNVIKTILETFDNNVETYLANPRKKSGKRQEMKKLNFEYKKKTEQELSTWFEPIFKEFPNITFKFQTGQPYNLSNFIWIRLYQKDKKIKGTSGHYCGISFDFTNQKIALWSGFGITKQKIQDIEKMKKEYILEYESILENNKIRNGFKFIDEYGNANMLYKEYKKEEITTERLQEDLRYLLGIYIKCEGNKKLDKLVMNESDKKEDNQKGNIFLKSNDLMGRNIIYKGFPGTGKSYAVKEKFLKDIPEEQYERVIFYPEYTNAEFIGTIRPTIENYNPVYKFFPGPFTVILKKAINNPNSNFYLIIEELNRGNAESIFGDVFHLLDREGGNGKSEFSITNELIANEVYGDKNQKVYIPKNLSIIATMNVSDENVKSLDTAFERRWETIWFLNNNGIYDNMYIKGMNDIKWGVFRNTINKRICMQKGIIKNEDKQLGPYFINRNFVINTSEENNKGREEFLNKVIMYLFTKICKYDKTIIFKEDFSITQVYDKFLSDNFMDVFNEDIQTELLFKQKETI